MEYRKEGQVSEAGSVSLLFLAGLVGVQACCFLDCVRAGYFARDGAAKEMGRIRERAENAPLLEYRIEKGCSYIRSIRELPHSRVLLDRVKHTNPCSDEFQDNEFERLGRCVSQTHVI